MNKRSLFGVTALAVLAMGANLAQAGPGTLAGPFGAYSSPSKGTFYNNSPAGVWSASFGDVATATTDSGTPLRKFVDRLPGLGVTIDAANQVPANVLGQYIPVAVPDTTTFPGSDYYMIGLQDYAQKLHSDLPKATKLRGYYQINGTDHTNQYLGPLIIAKSYDPTKPAGVAGNGKPVRVLFENHLGIGTAGDTFIPMDPTVMGADTSYTQNRAVLHLHGGATPWISDGTPHQWITPVGENTTTKLKGVSQHNVPDMPDPGQGKATYYFTNQQSGRMMFYHDHSYGTTRLNVYAGEAAGYLLYDQTEEDLIKGTNVSGNNPNLSKVLPDHSADLGTNYTFGIPLIIQDKTFVSLNTASVQDTKWTNAKWGAYGDLWFPHVYETNQDPAAETGADDFGRWDYGPWFWPPVLIDPTMQPASWAGKTLPEVDLTTTPEAFSDTPLVNGTAYPFVQLNPQAYRFRILNAANDRAFNLQLYVADPNVVGPAAGKEVAMVYSAPRPACTAASIAATPTVPSICTCTAAFAPLGCFPATWPVDGRDGGVPDPQFAGPKMIQIGTEGGFLPAPVVLDNQPVAFEYNRRNIVVLDILHQTLLLGAAERADVIVDFSAFAGKNVILYNDAPAPMPAFDPRYDYYTNDPDNTWMGGAPTTLAGFGPNTRTIMQFQIANTAPQNATPLYNDPAYVGPTGALTTAIQAAFTATQPKPIVPETAYSSNYPAAGITKNVYGRIFDNNLTFTPIGSATPTTVGFKSKAIQELWDPYGRMNATLGVELPFTNNNIQTTIPLGYVDPVTEVIHNNETQLWKITHNGVDTHPVHFHLFNVQLVNRVGWDGAVRPPEPNELGWKETVRMKPLEDVIVAFRPVNPILPFAIPNSIRPLDPTQDVGATLNLINPVDGNPISVVNNLTNFGYEYVWHCHILGHEENDFMRPMIFNSNETGEILWRNSSNGKDLVWNMAGVNYVSATLLDTDADQNWKIVGKGDFNSDNNRDILWRNTATGANRVWIMNGTVHTSTVVLDPEPDLTWQIVGVGDFNRDGKPDILWRKTGGTSSGQDRVWFMDGTTHTTTQTIAQANTNLSWQIVGVGDFKNNGDVNNGGKADILWRNSSNGKNIVWLMNGPTYVSTVLLNSEPDQNWKIVGAADFNDDVYTDILWRNTSTGADRVWFMSGTTYLGTKPITQANTNQNWQIVGH